MLVQIAEVNGEIKFLPAKGGNSLPVPQTVIDNIIENTAMEEVYVDIETQQLAEEYEAYHGTEEVIVGEVAVLLNTLVNNLRNAGLEIVRKD